MEFVKIKEDAITSVIACNIRKHRIKRLYDIQYFWERREHEIYQIQIKNIGYLNNEEWDTLCGDFSKLLVNNVGVSSDGEEDSTSEYIFDPDGEYDVAPPMTLIYNTDTREKVLVGIGVDRRITHVCHLNYGALDIL